MRLNTSLVGPDESIFASKKKGAALTFEQRTYLVQQHTEWGRGAKDLARTAKTTVGTVYRYVKAHRETEDWTELQNLN